MRGACAPTDHAKALRGIIPACAGSMGYVALFTLWRGDHPRVCGEHLAKSVIARVSLGSSPRVRGACYKVDSETLLKGIIPACAGSMGYGRSSCRATRDHPRVCGEHEVTAPKTVQHKGSSPRVRGAYNSIDNPVLQPGIIPACAGSILNYPRSL